MFTTKSKIYFYDCDPAGIMFFANIFKFAHSAYEDFMKCLETEQNYFLNSNFVLPIIHSEADYLLPLKAGDEVEINVIVSQLKNSSFELSYNVYVSDKTVAKVKTVHVCVKKEGFIKTELPEDLHNKLKGYLV